MKKIMLLAAALVLMCSAAFAQTGNPYADGKAAAPDEWLLVKKGNPWWYETKPSPHLFSFKSVRQQQQNKRSSTGHAHWS